MFIAVLLRGTLCEAIKEQDSYYSKRNYLQFVTDNNLAIILKRHFLLHLTERSNSPYPILLSPRFDWVMSSAKITSSTPVPQKMECRWCRPIQSVRSERADHRQYAAAPLPPGPRLLLATLSSGPHLMGHNIILRYVPALYTSSKHNSVAKAQ